MSRGVSLVDGDECNLLWNRSDIQFLLYVDSWNIFFNYTTDYIIDMMKIFKSKAIEICFQWNNRNETVEQGIWFYHNTNFN